MTCQVQVVVYAPQPAARRCQSAFDGGAQIERGIALEPRAATADGAQRMRVAVAQFGPAIHAAIGRHGDAVGVDTAEAGVPRLDAVQPGLL